MNSNNITKISIILILLIGGFLGYKYYQNQKIEPIEVKTDLHKIDIGYSRLRISLPVFVAKEKGFFENHGIDANLIMYETAQPLMQSLIAGNIDLAGYTALPITYNGMLKSKKQLYFVSTMIEDKNHRISYLLRPKTNDGDTPIINSIQDLKGKRIGILPTIAYKAWIMEILRKNGLDPEKDVVIQQIAPTQQAQALKNGGVDVLFTNDPAATSAIEVGVAELISKDVESPKYIRDPFPFGSFNVSKKWADANEDIYKKIVLAMDESVDYVNSHPKEAKEMMKKYLPESFKKHVSKYPDASYLNTTNSNEKLFNEISDLYLEIGIIKDSLDLTGLIE